MRGWFVQQRHYLARYAARYPRTTVTAIHTRKWWWWLLGWPLTTSTLWLTRLVLAAGLLVWVVPTGLVSTIASTVAEVVTGWPAGRDGVALAAVALTAAGYTRWKWNTVDTDVFGLLKSVWRYAGRGTLLVNAALVMPPVVVTGTITAFWVGLAADLIIGATSRRAALIRSYAEFRRELPDHWADLAARSKRIQSIDVGLERTVSDAANARPILEHPALGGLFDTMFDVPEFKVAVPVARPEGRSLDALAEVVDELAAQLFAISDALDAIKIVSTTPVRSNFASWAWLEISFKPPSVARVPLSVIATFVTDLLFGGRMARV